LLKPTILCGKPPRGLNARRHSSCPSKSRMEDGPEVMKRRPRHSLCISSSLFESYSREITIDKEKKLFTDTNIPAKMVTPAMPFTVNEIRVTIRVLNPKKAPNYDLITNQVLQKLLKKV